TRRCFRRSGASRTAASLFVSSTIRLAKIWNPTGFLLPGAPFSSRSASIGRSPKLSAVSGSNRRFNRSLWLEFHASGAAFPALNQPRRRHLSSRHRCLAQSLLFQLNRHLFYFSRELKRKFVSEIDRRSNVAANIQSFSERKLNRDCFFQPALRDLFS